MKDIGFGILDRYTVVIVIIVLALSSLVFGLQIPLDTSNATQLIFSLVVFTGYLYLARSIIRLPVAIIRAIIVFDELAGNIGPSYRGLRGVGNRLIDFFTHLRWTPISFYLLEFYYILQITFDFSDPQIDREYPSKRISKIKSRSRGMVILLEVADRLSIAVIAYMAMLDVARPYVEMLGIIGSILMLLVFLLRGHFSLLVPDEMQNAVWQKVLQPQVTVKEAQPREVTDENWYEFDVTGEKVTRLGTSTVKISKCENCGKVCAENDEGTLPRFCSLKCLQEWYPTWEHDWSIGQGRDRDLIEGQRSYGYEKVDSLTTAVGKLKATLLKQNDQLEAFWAMLGMVRDVSGGSDDYWRYERISAIEAAFYQVLKKKEYLAGRLLLVLMDENETVVKFALKFIQKFPPDPKKVDDTPLRSVLNHSSWSVRNIAIPILAKLGRYDDLFARLGKSELFENTLILQTFCERDSPEGVAFLEKAQRHPVRSVQREATEALFNMGIEAKRPTIIERVIECPYEECRAPVVITYPTDYMEFTFKGVEELSFWQFRKHKSRCPKCRTRIGINLDNFVPDLIHKQNEEWYAKLLETHKNSLSSVNE